MLLTAHIIKSGSCTCMYVYVHVHVRYAYTYIRTHIHAQARGFYSDALTTRSLVAAHAPPYRFRGGWPAPELPGRVPRAARVMKRRRNEMVEKCVSTLGSMHGAVGEGGEGESRVRTCAVQMKDRIG